MSEENRTSRKVRTGIVVSDAREKNCHSCNRASVSSSKV